MPLLYQESSVLSGSFFRVQARILLLSCVRSSNICIPLPLPNGKITGKWSSTLTNARYFLSPRRKKQPLILTNCMTTSWNTSTLPNTFSKKLTGGTHYQQGQPESQLRQENPVHSLNKNKGNSIPVTSKTKRGIR